ncbi:hypothetical protein JXA70_10455 [candidate division KSB1 bacterium]|nr:hypothetical protein [candidate division KSB1 bacterium]
MKRKTANRKMFIFILHMFATLPLYSQGQPHAAPRTTTVGLSVLEDHRFLSNSAVRSPFIQTFFRNNLGVGQALDLELPILNIGDETIWGLRGDLMFVGLEFEYQHAVKSWMAPFLTFSIYGRLGSGMQSMLAQGMTYGSELELGWLFRLRQTKRSQWAASVNLWNSSGAVMNLYDYINGIIEDGPTPDNQLFQNRPFLRGGGGLRYSWAATRTTGLTVTGEFGYGESVDRRIDNKVYVNVLGAADIDLFQSKYKVPLGFVLSAGVNTFASGTDNTIAGDLLRSIFSVIYTGRPDFVLSVDVIWTRLPLKQLDQTINSSMIMLNSKYIF